ncbi:MAG: TonB-dependent receptor [Cyanobacteria bacterium P01_E01_bin.42]
MQPIMKNLHHLHVLWVAPAIAIVSSQSMLAQIIEITNVGVETTPEGLEIILDGSSGNNIELFQAEEGNRLILDINNVRLLGGDIERENPVEGVSFLQVTSSTENSIQVIIVGEIAVPTIAGVTQTDEQISINLSVTEGAIANEATPIAEIANVFLNPTETGLELLLEGNIERDLELFQTIEEKRLIVNINNAYLIGGYFEQENPVEGVNFLQVISLTENTIQAILTGAIAAPEITGVTQTDERVSINLLVPATDEPIASEATSIAEITDVLLNETEEGLEILLDGNIQETLELFQTIEDNRLIIEINNARLVGEDIERENPVEGVDFLEVISPTEDSIQAILTGEFDAPEITEVFQSDGQLSINLFVFLGDTLIITVTADKFEESIQDVPISITAFSEEEIEDANLDSLDSIAENTPNFSIFGQGSASGFFTSYSIRGLSNSNFLNRDSVAFFVDDIPYDNGAYLDIDLIDIERIEVLRGPQNTLYGRNAQAGVVNIITRRPSNEVEGKFSADYGTFNQRRASLAVSAPLDEDNLFLRLSGQINARDGYITNTAFDREVGDMSAANVRGTLLWTPNEDWEISFHGYYDSNANETPIVQLLDQDDLFSVSQDFDNFSSLSTNSQALKIGYNNPNFEATAITARRYSEQNVEFDADFTTTDLFVGVSTNNSTVFSQELRFQSPSQSGDRWQWLIGGYFENRLFNNVNDGLRYSSTAAALFGFPGAGFDRTSAELDQTTVAAFGQVSYQPVDPLTLTLGLRYDSSTVTMDRRRNYELDGSSTTIPFGTTFSGEENSSDELLPRLAIEYEVSPSATLYGSVTRGYKPAGLNYRAESSDVLAIAEERSWNYELGVKTAWFDDRLIANLALFHSSIDDFQVGLADVTGIVRNIANAQASITGLELELKARPMDGLDITAGFGYTDAEYDSFFNPFTGQTLDGNRLSFAPEYTFNFSAQYRAPWGLFARAELSTLGSYFTEETNTISQETVTTVNATLGYEFDDYGIYFIADNIFDTRFITSGFTFGADNVGNFSLPFTARLLFKASF